MLLHTQPLTRVRHTCAGWGERCCGGSSGSVVSQFAVLSFREEAALNSFLFSLPLIPGMLKLDWWTFQNFVFQTLSAIITSRCTLFLYSSLIPLLWSSFVSFVLHSLSLLPCCFKSVCVVFLTSFFPPLNFPPTFRSAHTFPVRYCFKSVWRCVGDGAGANAWRGNASYKPPPYIQSMADWFHPHF